MFNPYDAYVVAIDKDGNVLLRSDLGDPDLIPTVVAEFEFDGDRYRAVYHDELDVWEFPIWMGETHSENRNKFTQNGGWYKACSDDQLYKCADETIIKFKDKIFQGPANRRLKAKWVKDESEIHTLDAELADIMTMEMIEEMDADFIRHYYAINNIPIPPRTPKTREDRPEIWGDMKSRLHIKTPI